MHFWVDTLEVEEFEVGCFGFGGRRMSWILGWFMRRNEEVNIMID